MTTREQVLRNILTISDDEYEEMAMPMVLAYVRYELGLPTEDDDERRDLEKAMLKLGGQAKP